MKKYLQLQFKRMRKTMVLVILVAAFLVCGIYAVYQATVTRWSAENSTEKFTIAMVGTADDALLRLGISAAQTMDASRFTVELVEMEEKQASDALYAGEIAAYIVVPDGFLDHALQGELIPLKFVSETGGKTILTVVKQELSAAVSNLVLSSEQGSFALYDALTALGHGDIAYQEMNNLANLYAGQIFNRDNLFSVEYIGVSEGLDFEKALLCGLTVLLLMLMSIPFAGVFVRDSYGLERLLCSKGVGAFKQVLSELVLYGLSMLVLVTAAMWAFSKGAPKYLLAGIPVALCIASLCLMIYSITEHLVSAVILQMLLGVGMCFVSGCIYPISFFPASIQSLARFLPTGVIKTHFSGALLGRSVLETALLLTAFSVSFFTVCVGVRKYRIVHHKGGIL